MTLSAYEIQCNVGCMVRCFDSKKKKMKFTFVHVFWCPKTLSFDHEYSWFINSFIMYWLIMTSFLLVMNIHGFICSRIYIGTVLQYYFITLIVNNHVLIIFYSVTVFYLTMTSFTQWIIWLLDWNKNIEKKWVLF